MKEEKKKLINLIQNYILSIIDFNTFYNEYSKVYLDENEKLTDKEIFEETFEEIFNKSDWVSLEKEIDNESRSYGYINLKEFKEWLVNYLTNIVFLKNE